MALLVMHEDDRNCSIALYTFSIVLNASSARRRPQANGSLEARKGMTGCHGVVVPLRSIAVMLTFRPSHQGLTAISATKGTST